MVISELSASFIPMVTEEIHITDGTLKISALRKKAIEILKTYDRNGNEVAFNVEYTQIKVLAPIEKVLYRFHPDTYALNDKIDYQEKDIPESVLAYGLAAEFALSEGDFDRACSLHDRYVEGVHAICKPKNSKIKQRSWQ
jgi:hypothetical protein